METVPTHDREAVDEGYGVVGPRGRRPGQKAPKPSGSDMGGRPLEMGRSAPPPAPEGPMSIAAPVNDVAALLHRFGRYPSKGRPNGPALTLKSGQMEYNAFEGKWIE